MKTIPGMNRALKRALLDEKIFYDVKISHLSRAVCYNEVYFL